MKVYVGYDSREHDAYEVCIYSLRLYHPGADLEIIPLKIDELTSAGLYTRPVDPLASTEFAFSRFLTPCLAKTGWAMFVDCDFLFCADVAELFAMADPKYAVMCVHHDYRPSNTTKMDGQVQTQYPRKNWSSMVLWNCDHPANKVITPEVVNSATGAYLHRFQWLKDELIGEVPYLWNWLEGWYEKPKDAKYPKAIHYTNGAPNFANCQNVDYAEDWRGALKLSRAKK